MGHVYFHFTYNGSPYQVSKQIQVHNRPTSLEIVDASTHNALATPLIGSNYYFRAIHLFLNTPGEVMNYTWTLQAPNTPWLSNMCNGLLHQFGGGQNTMSNPTQFHCEAQYTLMLQVSDGCGVVSSSKNFTPLPDPSVHIDPTCVNGTPNCTGGCHLCNPPPPTCWNGTPWCTGWCNLCNPPDYDCPCDCQYPTVCIHDCPAEFTYSPNPVGNELLIDFTYIPAAGYSIKLIDNSGVTLRESNFNHRQRDGRTRSVRFNVTNLPEGTYYLHVQGNKKIQKQQIVVNMMP